MSTVAPTRTNKAILLLPTVLKIYSNDVLMLQIFFAGEAPSAITASNPEKPYYSCQKIFNVFGSSKFNKYGPRIIPVISIPSKLGSLSFSKIFPSAIPHKNARARDNSIFLSYPICSKQKSQCFCNKKITEVISFISGLGFNQGRTSFPVLDCIANKISCQ